MEDLAGAGVAARADDDHASRARPRNRVSQGRSWRVVASEVEGEIDHLRAGGDREADAFGEPELGPAVVRIEDLHWEDHRTGCRSHGAARRIIRCVAPASR